LGSVRTRIGVRRLSADVEDGLVRIGRGLFVDFDRLGVTTNSILI